MSDDKETVTGPLAKINRAIAWATDRAIDGVPGVSGASDFAEEYLHAHPDPETAIRHLINWQTIQAGAIGAVLGVGGATTLPLALPANLAAVLYVQLRMVAAIAHIRGYDLESEKIRGFIAVCLADSSTIDTLKDVGINIGTKMTAQMIKKIPGSVIIELNKKVGFRLLTKAGSTGVINLPRLIPVLGGLISGGVDAAMTRAIAEAAKSVFAPTSLQPDAPPADIAAHGSAAS